MTDSIYKYLDAALDIGITERDFWQMTLAELDRSFRSKQRQIKLQEKKQASFDYVLADLIGRSIARVYNSSNKYPSIYDAYPSIYTEDEIKATQSHRDRQRFIAGLQQFAQTHNMEVGKLNDK